ncbi:MAG: hypothetical protein MUE69_25980 [Myxococcota bacterium]|jgi:hypothetical protein|nr:hypothetical protein [Myxococcota bacterium]
MPIDPGVRWLLAGAVTHALVALFAGLALVVFPAAPGELHHAIKPLKFGISIAIFLGTWAILLPHLDLGPRLRLVAAILLVGTMVVESACIVVQALRGRGSHFNSATALDAGLWNVMVAAIVLTTATLVVLALVATVRPLGEGTFFAGSARSAADFSPVSAGSAADFSPVSAGSAADFSPTLRFAWRAALWILLLVAVSGFGMGGRLQHSVGGVDGGAGLPLLGWSRLHGDLRVPHFVALHVFQALPLAAWCVDRVFASSLVRFALVGAFTLVAAAVAVGTLRQALAGRPWIAARVTESVAMGAPPTPDAAIDVATRRLREGHETRRAEERR